MRVSIPATAALAAFIHTAEADAKAVAELPTSAAQALIDESAKIEAELQRQRDINNAAQTSLCESITILDNSESALEAVAHDSGAVTLLPGAFHFDNSIVTFPPHDPESNKAPEIIIQWPDLVEIVEPGIVFVTEGKNQHIVLEDQSLFEDQPYYTKGFVAEAITADVSTPMQCFADAAKEDGAWTIGVSCSDHMGQMSTLTLTPTQAQLGFFFDIATSPIEPLRLGCMWEADLPGIEMAPNGP